MQRTVILAVVLLLGVAMLLTSIALPQGLECPPDDQCVGGGGGGGGGCTLVAETCNRNDFCPCLANIYDTYDCNGTLTYVAGPCCNCA
jgi:hypothetical protein